MPKYINADALKEAFLFECKDVYDDTDEFDVKWGASQKLIEEVIDSAPAADVEEVRHGRWIQTKDGDFACSLCGYIVKGEPMNYPPDGQMMLRMKGHRYCGDCGAKMMGE